jgi:hypothetical protein
LEFGKKEGSMGPKKSLACCSLVLFLTLLFAVLVLAQITPLNRFKGVNIPVSLKIKDKILEKGVYDLEFRRTPSPVLFYIVIMKGGKTLDTLQGEEWPYGTGIVSDIFENPDIPQKPTLKMAKNKDEKLLIIVFESGRETGKYPMVRARFKIPYEE